MFRVFIHICGHSVVKGFAQKHSGLADEVLLRQQEDSRHSTGGLWETLTFDLWNGACDGGAGGGDCAHGRAHTVRWVRPRHSGGVSHPGSRVYGTDRLT